MASSGSRQKPSGSRIWERRSRRSWTIRISPGAVSPAARWPRSSRMSDGEELRALMRRFPAGVAVLTVDVDGERLGLTVGSLVSLSLEPPLVGVGVNRHAAMHELLRRAGGFALSLLAAGQEDLAQHFARGVPPIALWHGVATRAGAAGAPLPGGRLGL